LLFAAGFDLEAALHEIRTQPNNEPTSLTSNDYVDNGRSTSNQELEASSTGPHSSIKIPEETTIHGYPNYQMDNFIDPDEGFLDLGENKEEAYKNESLYHHEIETQIEQFNESEDLPQYLDKEENTVLLVNPEPTDESLQDNREKNSGAKLHELSVDGDDSLEVCVENPFCRNIDVRADDSHTKKSAPFSPNEECEILVEDLEVGEKGLHPANFLKEPTGSPHERMFGLEFVTTPLTVTSLDKKDPLLQTDIALGSLDTSLHYDEAGDHQVSVHESAMELCYMCDSNKDDDACEETLYVEDSFALANVGGSVEVNELLAEDLETKSLEIIDGPKVNDEALVENLKLDEQVDADVSAPIPFMVKNEVLVEAYENNEKDCAEGAILSSPVMITNAFVAISKLNEEGNAKGGGPAPLVLRNEVLVESLKNNEIDSTEGDASSSPVVNNEVLVKTMETNVEVNADGGVPNPFALLNEVIVEGFKINEIYGAEGGASSNNEVLAENSELKEESDVEDGVPLSLDVKSEVLDEASKINEKYSAEVSVRTSSLVNCVVPVELNEEDNCNLGVPISSVDHAHGLLQYEEYGTEVSVESINGKEEESADTGEPTPSVNHVHEMLQEPANLSCHEPETPPSTKDEEYHNDSVRYADLVSTTERRIITQSCTISLDNPLYDASPFLSEECSELHSNKPVSFKSLHNDQEKLQENINQIDTGIFDNDSISKPWTVDPNKSVIAESCFHSSSVDQDRKVAQEGFNSKPGNILSGNKRIEKVLANGSPANVSVETTENELDMCSAYSLASEDKPPPLPPLGWRMGGKLSTGTSLPSNGHASKPIDETNENLSLQMRSMEAPAIDYHDDYGRLEGEKPRIMSLSDLPPLSCQHELANPNLTSVPISGVNVQNVEYNGLTTGLGLTGPEMRVPQYVWPDAQHPFLPVSAWNTAPSLVQVHQPGYLISLEDNLWAQYGIRPPMEDKRLGRKHHSIRNMPRNPLMDAVAAHDRSTVIFYS
jgi:hypothetical protein